MPYSSVNKIRIVTAGSLFDGHDAAINIMRRIMQAKGAEVIHLGHNRSVYEIVSAAIEEDAHAIAITSYQGGHIEFFKYTKDLLEQNGCGHIKLFGGGGGTILPHEAEELHQYGITRIYSPDDGRQMGLEGMITDLLEKCDPGSNAESDFFSSANKWGNELPLDKAKDTRKIARAITHAELGVNHPTPLTPSLSQSGRVAVLGISGTGGAGKSSVTDEIARRYLHFEKDKTIAVLSVDPSKKKTGGALLGDRIRMNSISHPRAYMRSMATRHQNTSLSGTIQQAIDICKAAGFDLIILESAGVGQSDASILDYCDVSMYVMTPEYGAASQLEKINMLDYADIICINKYDKPGALDALADVRKQYKRNHNLWTAQDNSIPVIGTVASKFNDDGMNHLFDLLLQKMSEKTGIAFDAPTYAATAKNNTSLIPPNRSRYLAEISDTVRSYNKWAEAQSSIASKMYQLDGAIKTLK